MTDSEAEQLLELEHVVAIEADQGAEVVVGVEAGHEAGVGAETEVDTD